jgi:MoxR-like ATPase
MAEPTVVGRDEELSQIEAFLESGALPRAFVLEGEAGIGKTTLWRAAVAAAAARGFRVLVAEPGEREQSLAFAALGDLLRDVVQGALPELPPPQRQALRVALLLDDPELGCVVV